MNRKTGLLLIDFQTGFDAPFWGKRNNPKAEKNALALLAAFRRTGRGIYHVRHLSISVGSPLVGEGTRFKPGFFPSDGEAQFDKTSNSAFIGTDLEARLRADEITRLVVAGLTTPHCVSTSARMAANLGFQVWVAGDACAAFEKSADFSFLGPDDTTPDPSDIHLSALSHLQGEFADVLQSELIIGRMVGRDG